MKTSSILPLFLFLGISCFAQRQTIQERLGYSKDTKLLIIHADDIGVAHAANLASIAALEKGSVSSGSIMVPCPWFGEIAAYAAAHPDADLGLHLTLTSEWKFYKWKPVIPVDQVPTLVDSRGYFYDNVTDLYTHAQVKEAELELRAQIDRAKQFGINPTHLDSHMGSAFFNPNFLQVLIAIGRSYKIPVLLNDDLVKVWLKADSTNTLTDSDVVFSKILMATPEDYKKGMPAYYSSVIESLQPGLTYLILHAAYDNEEMQAVTIDHPDYGAAWRQADFNFFTSAQCRKLLADQHVKVITWREIKQKLYKN
jgi:chitin disaccharide deacetylase